MSNSFVTPWTVACQAPLSMAFPRQECWRGLPFPFAGDLSHPGKRKQVSNCDLHVWTKGCVSLVNKLIYFKGDRYKTINSCKGNFLMSSDCKGNGKGIQGKRGHKIKD